MNDLNFKLTHPKHRISIVFCFTLIFAMLTASLPLSRVGAQIANNDRPNPEKYEYQELPAPGFSDVLPGFNFSNFLDSRRAPRAIRPEVGTDLGTEQEPNGTPATATALTASEGRIKGNILTQLATITTDGADVDVYSVTTTAPNSRLYAGTMTSFGNGTDSTLEVIASDGTTVIETDTADGTFAASSGNVAGTNLATPGVYYLRVTSGSASTPIAPYYLYFAVKSATPTAETEPNNLNGTPNPIGVSGLMSGAINPAADNDTFSFAAGAGDTIFVSLDTDPERDNVQWNGRIGIGTFGNPTSVQVINDASTGTAANPLSETFILTPQAGGTFLVYVDEAAGSGAATDTYALNVTVVPASASCTTFTNNTPTPITDAGLTSSTINVPGNPIVARVRVTTNITHTSTADLDVHLVSPAGNDNGLYSDVATAAGQVVQINSTLGDEAGSPIGSLGANEINAGINYMPETAYRLAWFNGASGGGDWRLDVRDDTAGNTGTLNSWALEVCTDTSSPSGSVIYSQDFEANDGGYTHSGAADEWEYGTPATAIAAGVAGFTTCSSGTKCWKTDLDNTYENSSNQELVSPSISLMGVAGPITLTWNSRYSIENVSFDRGWVRVSEVGNPSNSRIVWHTDNPTMTDSVGTPTVNIGGSVGWARFSADISDFVNKNVQVTFHLDTDTSVVLAGWAVDDVQVRATQSSVFPVNVSGRVVSSTGRPIARAVVTLTEQNGTPRIALSNGFGFYYFDNVLTGQSITVNAGRKGYTFTPQMVMLNNAATIDLTGTGTP